MGTVGSLPLFQGLVNLNVEDEECVDVQSLYVIVTYCILKMIKDKPAILSRPAVQPFVVEVLGSEYEADTVAKSHEGDRVLADNDAFKRLFVSANRIFLIECTFWSS